MSTLLGVLQLVGRGGNELFVYDDALVRAGTGAGAAMLAALSGEGTGTAEGLLNAMSGDLERFAHQTPEQVADASPSNLLVRRENVAASVLSRGRWPSTGQRRLTLTSPRGATLVFSWPGDGATRPLNHDGYVVPLLTRALGDLLDVQL